jgi:N-acetylglucosamine malate deacetylase 2
MSDYPSRFPAGDELLERFCAPAHRLTSMPRTLAVLAHPDDETLGASSRLRRLRHAIFVYVTDGAPLDEADAYAAGFPSRELYALARRAELQGALFFAGIPCDRVRPLNIVDQAASLHLAWLTEKVLYFLLTEEPEVVLTHPYEGGHPDHDATAFAVHMACRLVAQHDLPTPAIIEFTSYNGAGGSLTSGGFLPAPGHAERAIALDPEDVDFKQGLIACYATQQHILHRASLHEERFRLAPAYDFEAPPHEGTLLYEHCPWRMNGARWRTLARAATDRLELAPLAR